MRTPLALAPIAAALLALPAPARAQQLDRLVASLGVVTAPGLVSSEELGDRPLALAPTDPIWEGGGPGTARALLGRAEAALAEADPKPADAAAVRRARRLTVGARAAMTSGDHELALRRSRYACQLLAGCALEASGR